MNQTAWCKANNISRNSFKNWKSRLTEYTLQELNSKTAEIGLPVSGTGQAVNTPVPANTSAFAELPADIVEPVVSSDDRQGCSGSPIEISYGKFIIHMMLGSEAFS